MRTALRTVLLLLACAGSAAVDAADLRIQVNDEKGHPVPDAVVTVLPQDLALKVASRRPPGQATRTIDQKNETFVPYVEVFRAGDKVQFRNSDTMRHHVYTFSPLKPFEFVLVPGETSRLIQLDQAGVIAVGCNIHDQMITYLYVSDAPWLAKTGANGRAEFRDVPAGAWNVRVWHPRLKPGKPDLAQSATLVAADESKQMAFALSLLPDSRRDFDRERTQY